MWKRLRVGRNMIRYSENSEDLLVEGKFAKVYRGVLRAHNGKRRSWPETYVVVKVFKQPVKTVREFQSVFREVEVARKCCHPTVVGIVSFWIVPACTIVMEMCRTNLGDVINDEKAGVMRRWINDKGEEVEWNSTKKSIVAAGIAAGLSVMHRRGCIHRDIKPSNILLDVNMYPKIAGFGLSRELSSNMTQNGVGTALYMAPEMFTGEEYGTAVDVHSYGVTLCELAACKPTFIGIGYAKTYDLYRAAGRGEIPEIPSYVPRNWRVIIEKCWAESPENRPTIEEVFWMADQLKFDNDVDDIEFNGYLEMIRS